MYDTSSNSCEDRISNLPESVTTHILSHLPTKEAVQTCVLSTDWKYKWTSINNVEIIDSRRTKESAATRAVFIDFMTRLSLSHNIQSFSLHCFGYYDSIHMSEWISAVLGPKLETFRLYYDWEGLVLPKGIVHCTSLKTLILASRFTFIVPVVHTFPNLVELALFYVEIRNEDSVTSTMILKFLVLKLLNMKHCKWLNVNQIGIHAPSLTALGSETDFMAGDSYYSINVTGATKLKLGTQSGLHDNLIFTGSQVDCASLSNATGYKYDSKSYGEFALQVRKLLNELRSTHYLKISYKTAEAIAHPNPKLCLPRYDKLEILDIGYHISRHNSLLELLHAAPNLKILQIVHVKMVNSDDHNNHVIGHDVVPPCIISSLEELKIIIGRGSKSELYLAKFFMENGKKLKKMHLLFSHEGQTNARDFMEQLSRFTKASVHLQVVEDYKK